MGSGFSARMRFLWQTPFGRQMIPKMNIIQYTMTADTASAVVTMLITMPAVARYPPG